MDAKGQPLHHSSSLSQLELPNRIQKTSERVSREREREKENGGKKLKTER
jgi:hypothetical protein